jgi:aryl-alcohol dehydrogenase-like predicted oxidoreductase
MSIGMQFRVLGRTGIRVSEIGFGAWAIGGTAEASGMPIGWGRSSDDESLAAIRRARELGVNFFDTADSYGFGRSESLLGIVLSRFVDRTAAQGFFAQSHLPRRRRIVEASVLRLFP